MPARLRIEFLDGITQHGARHMVRVSVKESCKSFGITFAGLAQHPSGSLVNQRLTVIQKYFRQFGCQRRLAVFYVCVCGYNPYAPAPKVAVVHKLAQQIVVAGLKTVLSYDLGSREIHQIPVVYARGIRKIVLCYLCPSVGILAFFKPRY